MRTSRKRVRYEYAGPSNGANFTDRARAGTTHDDIRPSDGSWHIFDERQHGGSEVGGEPRGAVLRFVPQRVDRLGDRVATAPSP